MKFWKLLLYPAFQYWTAHSEEEGIVMHSFKNITMPYSQHSIETKRPSMRQLLSWKNFLINAPLELGVFPFRLEDRLNRLPISAGYKPDNSMTKSKTPAGSINTEGSLLTCKLRFVPINWLIDGNILPCRLICYRSHPVAITHSNGFGGGDQCAQINL